MHAWRARLPSEEPPAEMGELWGVLGSGNAGGGGGDKLETTTGWMGLNWCVPVESGWGGGGVDGGGIKGLGLRDWRNIDGVEG